MTLKFSKMPTFLIQRKQTDPVSTLSASFSEVRLWRLITETKEVPLSMVVDHSFSAGIPGDLGSGKKSSVPPLKRVDRSKEHRWFSHQ